MIASVAADAATLIGPVTTTTALVTLPAVVLTLAVAVAVLAGVFAPSRQSYARGLLRDILRTGRRGRGSHRRRRDDDASG